LLWHRNVREKIRNNRFTLPEPYRRASRPEHQEKASRRAAESTRVSRNGTRGTAVYSRKVSER
jgi:hypothetical protein